jgi:hypothetical protein
MTILIPVPDVPGYYVDLFYSMGKALKKHNFNIVFVVTSPYYPGNRKINLAEVGTTYFFNEYLQKARENNWTAQSSGNGNFWSAYSTFVRQSYFYGSAKNKFSDYPILHQFIEEIFAKYTDTVLVISELISNSFLYTIYNSAKSRSIPHLCYSASRIPGFFNIFLDDVVTIPLINRSLQVFDHDSEKGIPEYMNNSRFGGVFDKVSNPWGFVKEVKNFVLAKNYPSWEIGRSKNYIFISYSKFFKRRVFDFYLSNFHRIFSKDISHLMDKTLIIYPLHFRPEASTTVQAKYYENDYEIIKNIAFSLNPDQYLIVKEHKSNVGNNKLGLYNRIKSLPNTVLLDPYYTLKENIGNFDAAICLTSTVGFEALEQGVPVYVLGRVFYENYPGCIKINSFEQLELCVANIKKNIPERKNDITALYHKCNFPGTFNYMNIKCLTEENINHLISPILSYYGNN